MKKDKFKDLLLEQIKKIPIIQVACEKVGIARSSIYRWRNEDKDFSQKLDEALIEGEKFINDMSESQLINLIRDKNLPAINLWLRTHHPKYATKVHIEGNIQTEKSLTPEQEELIKKALELGGLNQKNYDSNST